MQKKHEELLTKLNETSARLFSCNLSETTDKQAYKVVCTLLRGMLAKKRKEYKDSYKDTDRKKVYYMSMEFLMGRALGNNLINMTAYGEVKEALEELEAFYEADQAERRAAKEDRKADRAKAKAKDKEV